MAELYSRRSVFELGFQKTKEAGALAVVASVESVMPPIQNIESDRLRLADLNQLEIFYRLQRAFEEKYGTTLFPHITGLVEGVANGEISRSDERVTQLAEYGWTDERNPGAVTALAGAKMSSLVTTGEGNTEAMRILLERQAELSPLLVALGPDEYRFNPTLTSESVTGAPRVEFKDDFSDPHSQKVKPDTQRVSTALHILLDSQHLTPQALQGVKAAIPLRDIARYLETYTLAVDKLATDLAELPDEDLLAFVEEHQVFDTFIETTDEERVQRNSQLAAELSGNPIETYEKRIEEAGFDATTENIYALLVADWFKYTFPVEPASNSELERMRINVAFEAASFLAQPLHLTERSYLEQDAPLDPIRLTMAELEARRLALVSAEGQTPTLDEIDSTLYEEIQFPEELRQLEEWEETEALIYAGARLVGQHSEPDQWFFGSSGEFRDVESETRFYELPDDPFDPDRTKILVVNKQSLIGSDRDIYGFSPTSYKIIFVPKDHSQSQPDIDADYSTTLTNGIQLDVRKLGDVTDLTLADFYLNGEHLEEFRHHFMLGKSSLHIRPPALIRSHQVIYVQDGIRFENDMLTMLSVDIDNNMRYIPVPESSLRTDLDEYQNVAIAFLGPLRVVYGLTDRPYCTLTLPIMEPDFTYDLRRAGDGLPPSKYTTQKVLGEHDILSTISTTIDPDTAKLIEEQIADAMERTDYTTYRISLGNDLNDYTRTGESLGDIDVLAPVYLLHIDMFGLDGFSQRITIPVQAIIESEIEPENDLKIWNDNGDLTSIQ